MSDTERNSEERTEIGPWERTVGEMREIARQYREDGWEVVAVRAGDTAPESPEVGESERFGFVHTVPNAVASDVRSVLDGDVDGSAIHRRSLGSTLFFVTEITDATTRRALLLAGAVDTGVAEELETAARERGELYTHVQLLDWTHLGTVRHDDPSAFFPESS